jgi:hypothetical protein
VLSAYPDFVQPVFAVEAESYHRNALKRAGEIETGSRMTPIRRALSFLEKGQRIILTAALAARVSGPPLASPRLGE